MTAETLEKQIWYERDPLSSCNNAQIPTPPRPLWLLSVFGVFAWWSSNLLFPFQIWHLSETNNRWGTEASTQLSYKGVTSDYCVSSPSEIVKQPVLFSHAARGWVWIYSVTHCATVTAKYKNATLLRASPQFFHPPTVLRSIKHTGKSVLYADSFRYYSAFEYEVFVLQTKCKFEKPPERWLTRSAWTADFQCAVDILSWLLCMSLPVHVLVMYNQCPGKSMEYVSFLFLSWILTPPSGY